MDPENFELHPALTSYFSYCLHKVSVLHRIKLTEALSGDGIIPPQLGILRLLIYEKKPLSQAELGAILSIDKATMVKLLDGLEEKEWIKRGGNSSDRRVKGITLTQKGKSAYPRLMKIRDTAEARLLSVLNTNDKKSLVKIIPELLRSSL